MIESHLQKTKVWKLSGMQTAWLKVHDAVRFQASKKGEYIPHAVSQATFRSPFLLPSLKSSFPCGRRCLLDHKIEAQSFLGDAKLAGQVLWILGSMFPLKYLFAGTVGWRRG